MFRLIFTFAFPIRHFPLVSSAPFSGTVRPVFPLQFILLQSKLPKETFICRYVEAPHKPRLLQGNIFFNGYSSSIFFIGSPNVVSGFFVSGNVCFRNYMFPIRFTEWPMIYFFLLLFGHFGSISEFFSITQPFFSDFKFPFAWLEPSLFNPPWSL